MRSSTLTASPDARSRPSPPGSTPRVIATSRLQVHHPLRQVRQVRPRLCRAPGAAPCRGERDGGALAAPHEPGDDPFAVFGAQEHAQSELHDTLDPGAGTLVVALPQIPGAEPLGHAGKEAARVAELLRPAEPVTVLTGPAATSQSVLDALPRHGTAHVVCHGLTDPLDPLDPLGSRLLLADHRERPLTLAVLADLRLRDADPADLAHLSACSTGVTAHRLADECVHITAAFQLCGCRQVVGTLWPVTDAAAEAVAEAFHARRVCPAPKP